MCELNKAKRQKHLTHDFSISVSGRASLEWMPNQSTFLLSVMQYIFFFFKKDALCVLTVVQLFLCFCLNIRTLKYKCYRCCHGNQHLKSGGIILLYNLFLRARSASKATRVVAEIEQIQLNLEYVDTYGIKKTLYASNLQSVATFIKIQYELCSTICRICSIVQALQVCVLFL